jgi:hypothetical protein
MPRGIYQHKPQQGFQKGHIRLNTGRTHFKKGGTSPSKGRKFPQLAGKNHWNWKGGITPQCRHRTQETRYKIWRQGVFARDNWKCRMDNKDCSGIIQAHHILGWTEYPELRYGTKNGITLCQAHHPLKRAEEKRLIPFFEELVSVSKVNISH